MSPRQPVVSGERLIKALRKEGWEVVRIAASRDPENWSESDSFEIAVNGLFADGLIRRQGDFLVPVRPVRAMADLGFSIS